MVAHGYLGYVPNVFTGGDSRQLALTQRGAAVLIKKGYDVTPGTRILEYIPEEHEPHGNNRLRRRPSRKLGS